MAYEDFVKIVVGEAWERFVGDLFDTKAGASTGSFREVGLSAESDISEVARADNLNEQISEAYDVHIASPSEAVEKKVSQGMYEDQARAEYAEELVRVINVIQEQLDAVIVDAERSGEVALRDTLMESWQRLEDLDEDISGGSTSMEALQKYYDRLTAIQNRAPLVLASN